MRKPSRHLAGLLVAGGWLLMTAPMEDGKRNTDAPVSEWVQVFAYDDAEACERARIEAMGDESGKRDQVMQETRCVPAGAIYSPAKSE